MIGRRGFLAGMLGLVGLALTKPSAVFSESKDVLLTKSSPVPALDTYTARRWLPYGSPAKTRIGKYKAEILRQSTPVQVMQISENA